MSEFSDLALELITEFGNEYSFNGASKSLYGIELSAEEAFRARSLVQGESRIFIFAGAVTNGELVSLDGRDCYITNAKPKRFQNVLLYTEIVTSV
jgi:hypothetical protein